MSNKANQESTCTNGTPNTFQSLQGTENRVGTQMHADTSVEQKAHDLCIPVASCPDCAAPTAKQPSQPGAAYAPLTVNEVRDLTCMLAGAPWPDEMLPELQRLLGIYDKLRTHHQRPVDPATLPRKVGKVVMETGLLPATAQQEPRCSYCDGTGDVHSIDGEWRGICTECEAGSALRMQAAPKAAPKDHELRELVNRLRDIAREFHGSQQLRERIAAEILPMRDSLATPKAAPGEPTMPNNWGVVASVNGENILCIGDSYLHGKRELSESEEQAIVGMAQHLLAFVGYGLPPSIFDPDDDAAPQPAPAPLSSFDACDIATASARGLVAVETSWRCTAPCGF